MAAGFEGWSRHHHIRINGEYQDVEDIPEEELYKIRKMLTERFAEGMGAEFVEDRKEKIG